MSEEVQTRAVTRPGDLESLTDRRDTDCRTAITRGLAEYLRQMEGVATGGRLIRFAKVLEAFAEPEVPAAYPAAVVYASQPGAYAPEAGFTPATIELPSGLTMRKISEFVQPLDLEVWCTDPRERMAFVAVLEDWLNPSEHQTGLLLELPHYHNARTLIEVQNMTYFDSGEDNQRRWRKAAFSLTATIPQYVSLGKRLPRLTPRIGTSIDTDVVTLTPPPFAPEAAMPVVVYEDGPQGPPGREGPEGPQGPPGPGGAGFNFTQAAPATVWTINHNLGYYPSVELFSVGGLEIDADVQHMSLNQTIVTFLIPTAGSARLN